MIIQDRETRLSKVDEHEVDDKRLQSALKLMNGLVLSPLGEDVEQDELIAAAWHSSPEREEAKAR